MKNQEALLSTWRELKAAKVPIFEGGKDTFVRASFQQMNGGMTNLCFKLTTKKGTYFLRLPGAGSSAHLSREDEKYNLEVAQGLGLNVEIFFFNPKTGMCVSEFLNETTPLSAKNLTQTQTMKDVARILKILHTSDKLFKNDIPIFERLENLFNQVKAYAPEYKFMYGDEDLELRLSVLKLICNKDKSSEAPCHNDTTPLNFLYHQGKLKLLDWEYSGNGKAIFDLANFAATAKLTREAEQSLLQAYFGKSPTKILWKVFDAYKQTTHLWYYLWAELQLANQSDVVPKNELIEVAQKHYNAVMCQEAVLPARRTASLK